jgi:predicted metal-dependent hydrolase
MKIEVVRSSRRKKTVSAQMDGETMVVRAPASMSEVDLQKAIENLRIRIKRRQEKKALSDDDLEKRARMLNRRFFGGRLRWRSIRWVSNQNKRFGSCTPSQGTIRISHRVGALPQWVQDYVFVHELAHLLEGNHGPHFWKLANRYPLTERARGYLMALGLEEDGSDFSIPPIEGSEAT